MEIRKVGIILKKESEQPKLICSRLQDFFKQHKIESQIDLVTEDCDMLVILGGDGTLLHVADQASRLDIPVVGVNLGGLGFLTEISLEDLDDALKLLLQGAAPIDKRMMLKTRLISKQSQTPWHYALNDVVISRGPVDRLVELSAWADKELITTYRADGLIFSSPTGSTAYNLSAGGPIVHPLLQSITVTPICPFMLESRPVLLPASVKISTKLTGGCPAVQVIVDGRQIWEMSPDDMLDVRAAEYPLQLICSPTEGYFEILRKKLNWGGGRDTSRKNEKGRPT